MSLSRRHLLAMLAASAALPCLASHDHGGAEPGKNAAPARAALATGAAFDRQGRLWVAATDAGTQIVLRWTGDAGQTWSAPRQVLRVPEPVEANGEGRPKLAFGPAGQLYLSYTSPLGKPHTGNIRFVRSQDGGTSFSDPVTLQSDRALTGHRFDSLIVDRAGRVFVAWVDKRNLDAARAAGRPYRGAAVYFTVSVNDGATFLPDARVADHACECCRIALSLDADGRVVAMWRHVFEPNIRDHALAVLHPSGRAGELVRASTDQWKIDACPHHGPALAFDAKGRRHQLWFNGAEEGGGLLYGAANAQGKQGRPQQIGGPQAAHGEVAASGKRLFIVWKEYDGSATRILARVSGDAGQSWRHAALAATGGASDHPHLVQHRGATWLVWHTELDGIIVRPLENV